MEDGDRRPRDFHGGEISLAEGKSHRPQVSKNRSSTLPSKKGGRRRGKGRA